MQEVENESVVLVTLSPPEYSIYTVVAVEYSDVSYLPLNVGRTILFSILTDNLDDVVAVFALLFTIAFFLAGFFQIMYYMGRTKKPPNPART